MAVLSLLAVAFLLGYYAHFNISFGAENKTTTVSTDIDTRRRLGFIYKLIKDPKTTDQKQTMMWSEQPSIEQNELIPRNEPGEIWIVNQPKCGTDAMQESIRHAFHCGASLRTTLALRKFFCDNDRVRVYRTHEFDTAERQKIVHNERVDNPEQWGEDGVHDSEGRGSCVVITAARNPIYSIPSYFFHSREHLCSGTHTEEEVIKEYENFLSNSALPPAQVETTVQMLRAFGAFDIRSTMELLNEKGYAWLDRPDENGPWARCRLLFLQIDYSEDNSNINEAFGMIRKGTAIEPANQRVNICPLAAHNYEAVLRHGISDLQIDKITAKSPDIRGVIDYYSH